MRKKIIEEIKKRKNEFMEDGENKLNEEDIRKLEEKILESNDNLNKIQKRMFGKEGIKIDRELKKTSSNKKER